MKDDPRQYARVREAFEDLRKVQRQELSGWSELQERYTVEP